MSNSVKSLDGRSMFSLQRRYIRIKNVIYAFTAGARGKIITAEILTKLTLFPNAVYVRTNGDLLCLEDFAHLKDLQSVLPTYFRAVNRGVVVNGRRIGFPQGSSAVGFWLRDHHGQRRKEVIRLSDDGKNEIEKFIIRPPRARSVPPPDPEKTPPRDLFPRGD